MPTYPTTEPMDARTDGIQAVIDTALLAAEPNELTPGKFYILHTKTGVQQIDLTGDQYKDQPTRKTGTTTVRDVPSFVTYWTKHSTTDSELYADAEKLTVTAVLDAHSADQADWGQHILRLGLRKTEAWTQWALNDGQLLAQEAFAEFLEDHLPELLEPSAAEMMEIAQSISGTAKADFQSGTRLSSGQRQFQYVETVTTKAGQKGQFTVPETFTIGLVPFEGSAAYKLTARLRYRLQGPGGMALGYKLDRPGDTLRTAFEDITTAISEQITTPILNGTPA